MAYKSKRRKKTYRKGSARKPSRRKSYSKRRGPAKRKSRASNSRTRGQTIRLVIEQAPQESSLELAGRPTRKAIF